MAIAALAAILALGLYAPTSVPQQEEDPIVIYATLCFVPGPVYSLSALLQANGVSVEGATVVKEEGNVVKVHANQLIETIALGPSKITVKGVDQKTKASVIVEINIMVVNCPNVQPPPPPQQAAMVPQAKAVNLCVGESRSIYFEVQVNAGGLLHRDAARITGVTVAPGGFIVVEPTTVSWDQPAYGWLRITGLIPGAAILTVSGQSQSVGLSPFTDVVTAAVNINVVACPAPPTVNSLCPLGTVRVAVPPLIPRVLPAIPPGGPRFLPANLPAGPYVGYERFEVGVTPRAGEPGGPAQWPFPSPGGSDIFKGWRTTLQGKRTDFYVWGPTSPFLDPNPPVPGPDRSWATRWVAYRGYFKCAAPLIILKFKDLDGDGIWDFGEPPIPGWKITVSGPVQRGQNPPIVAQGVTDATGLFSFTPSVAGTYRISEELRPGWQPTTSPFVTVAVVEQSAPRKGLIQPARIIPQIVPGVGLVGLAALFGNRPGLSISFRIGPNGSCHAPTTGLTISVQINRIEATLMDSKTGKPIAEGTPSAFVLNPKEGVHEIKTLDDVKDVTVYAEGYHPKTVPKGMIITVGFGPLAIQVMVLGAIYLNPLD